MLFFWSSKNSFALNSNSAFDRLCALSMTYDGILALNYYNLVSEICILSENNDLRHIIVITLWKFVNPTKVQFSTSTENFQIAA